MGLCERSGREGVKILSFLAHLPLPTVTGMVRRRGSGAAVRASGRQEAGAGVVAGAGKAMVMWGGL